jgi:hypothetical protein
LGVGIANEPPDGETIGFVKKPDIQPPHSGPVRMIKVAGILIAVGAVVLGIVGIPIPKWFLLGTIVVGCAGAAILHLRG